MAYTYNNKENLNNLYKSADLAGRKFLWLSTITGGFFVYSLLCSFANSAGLLTLGDEGFWLATRYIIKGVLLIFGFMVAYYLDARMIDPAARSFCSEFSGYLSSGDAIEKFTRFRQVVMWGNGLLLAGMLAVSFVASFFGPEIITSIAQTGDEPNNPIGTLTEQRAAAVQAETAIFADKLAKLEKKRDEAVASAMERAPKDVKKSYSKREEYGKKEMAAIVASAEKPFAKDITAAQKSLEEASKSANKKFDEIQELTVGEEKERKEKNERQTNTIEFILKYCGIFGLVISLFGTALWSMGHTAKELDKANAIKNANGNPASNNYGGSGKNGNQQWSSNPHHWTNP